ATSSRNLVCAKSFWPQATTWLLSAWSLVSAAEIRLFSCSQVICGTLSWMFAGRAATSAGVRSRNFSSFAEVAGSMLLGSVIAAAAVYASPSFALTSARFAMPAPVNAVGAAGVLALGVGAGVVDGLADGDAEAEAEGLLDGLADGLADGALDGAEDGV